MKLIKSMKTNLFNKINTVVYYMNETKISMKFNEDNELKFILEGNIQQVLKVDDGLKEKINYLIDKSDTSNFLIRLNGAFDGVIDDAIQQTFENTVNNTYDKENK